MNDRQLPYLTVSFVRWAMVVYRRIMTISPYCLIGSAVSGLISQLSMVVSFFLPLKVVFLLNADEVPEYVSEIFPESSLNQLLAVLMGLSIGAYFLYLAANRYAEILSSKGASEVIASTSKLTLFADQEEIARRSYFRFGSLLGGFFFLCSSLLIFLIFYQALFWIVFFSLAACFFLTSFFYRLSDSVVSNFSRLLHASVSQLYGVLFLFVFGFMVLHMLYLGEVNVYLSLVAILLIRQLFQRLTSSTVDAVLLSRQKEKVNALFLRDHPPVSSVKSREDAFIEILGHVGSSRWRKNLNDIVEAHNVEKQETALPDVHPLQSSIVDVFIFSLVWSDKKLLLKVYAPRHQLLSIRERDVLESGDDPVPSLGFLFASEVNGYKAHFYSVPNEVSIPDRKDFKNRRDMFRAESFKCAPSDEIWGKYKRSHALLSDRVRGWVPYLSIKFFRESLKEWEAAAFTDRVACVINDLPLQYVTPDVNHDSLLTVGGDNEVVCFNWERWCIEPVGFGLSLAELDLQHIKKLLFNSGLTFLDPHAIRLCGLVSILEGYINNQKIDSANKVLSSIVECLEELEEKSFMAQ